MARNFVNIINHLSDIKEMIHDNFEDDKDQVSDIDDGGVGHPHPAGHDSFGTSEDSEVSETGNCDRQTTGLTPNDESSRSSRAMRELKSTPISGTPRSSIAMRERRESVRERRESVRIAKKSRQLEIEKFNTHYMNTGLINTTIMKEITGVTLQPKFLPDSQMNTDPPHQSSGVINSPGRSAKKISQKRRSACSYQSTKSGAVDIEVHSPEKRSRANSSFKSERDHSNQASSVRDHSNPARSSGSGTSRKMRKKNSIEDYGMIDYHMNDQTLQTPKKHQEHICRKKSLEDQKKRGPCRQDTVDISEDGENYIEYKYKGSKTSKSIPLNRLLIRNGTILEHSQESQKTLPDEDMVQTRADLHVKPHALSRFAQSGDINNEEDDDSPKRIGLNIKLSVLKTSNSSDSISKDIKFDSQKSQSEPEHEPPTKFESFGVLSKAANKPASKDKEQRPSERESKTDNELRKEDSNDPKKTTSESDSEGQRDEEREDIGEMNTKNIKNSLDETKGEFSFGVVTRGQSINTELGADILGFVPIRTMQNSPAGTMQNSLIRIQADELPP